MTKEDRAGVAAIKAWLADDLGADVEDIDFLLDLTHRLDVTCRQLAEVVEKHHEMYSDSGSGYCRFCGFEREHDSDCIVLTARAALEETSD